MSRQTRITTVGVTVLLALLSIALVTSAFTPAEKTTIQRMKQRITLLEELTTQQAQQINTLQDSHDGLVGDLGVLMDNQLTFAQDVDILDNGLQSIVAEDGPLAQIDRNLAMTQEIVFANHPQIAITDIVSSSTCGETTCTAVIEWNSEPPATGQVEWGPTEAYGNFTTKEGGLLGFHRQSIGGLLPETTYHFRIIATLPDGTTAMAEVPA